MHVCLSVCMLKHNTGEYSNVFLKGSQSARIFPPHSLETAAIRRPVAACSGPAGSLYPENVGSWGSCTHQP